MTTHRLRRWALGHSVTAPTSGGNRTPVGILQTIQSSTPKACDTWCEGKRVKDRRARSWFHETHGYNPIPSWHHHRAEDLSALRDHQQQHDFDTPHASWVAPHGGLPDALNRHTDGPHVLKPSSGVYGAPPPIAPFLGGRTSTSGQFCNWLHDAWG